MFVHLLWMVRFSDHQATVTRLRKRSDVFGAQPLGAPSRFRLEVRHRNGRYDHNTVLHLQCYPCVSEDVRISYFQRLGTEFRNSKAIGGNSRSLHFASGNQLQAIQQAVSSEILYLQFSHLAYWIISRQTSVRVCQRFVPRQTARRCVCQVLTCNHAFTDTEKACMRRTCRSPCF